MRPKVYIALIAIFISLTVNGQKLVPVAEGWSNNSVNVTIFRKNSLVTEDSIQFIAYYDPDGFLTLGKRNIDTEKWEIRKTQYQGNVSDAHNSISIMTDKEGYLHVSWDHHGHLLRYAISKAPYSLELTDKLSMTGNLETNVTYPEFFRMPNGNLIFMYRDGQSGRGNLVLNSYDTDNKKWTQLQKNLIDGQGERNAYWQACTDDNGTIHLSWVWRETPDVATNHDLCYARSSDGGNTWENSKGEKYILPIMAANSEVACHIPQNSELINQTSMATDANGNPYIATYWRSQDSEIPQYHVVYNDGNKWNDLDLGFRKTPFSLSGVGTKRIPISRPQILTRTKGEYVSLYLLFRDEERSDKASVAICQSRNVNSWELSDLTTFSVGSWEPSYDTELWRNDHILDVFIQKVEQIDGEGKADITPQKIYVLEID